MKKDHFCWDETWWVQYTFLFFFISWFCHIVSDGSLRSNYGSGLLARKIFKVHWVLIVNQVYLQPFLYSKLFQNYVRDLIATIQVSYQSFFFTFLNFLLWTRTGRSKKPSKRFAKLRNYIRSGRLLFIYCTYVYFFETCNFECFLCIFCVL